MHLMQPLILIIILQDLLIIKSYIYVSVCTQPPDGKVFMATEKTLKVGILKSLKPKFIFEKNRKHTLFLGLHLSLINTSEAELSQKSRLHGNR